MGACLSKKGKKGEDPDRMPYTKKGDVGRGKKKKSKGKSESSPHKPDTREDQQIVDIGEGETDRKPVQTEQAIVPDSPLKRSEPDGKDSKKADETPSIEQHEASVQQNIQKKEELKEIGEEDNDLSGTQTSMFKQTAKHDPKLSTSVVKESDIKVEVTSDNQKKVQIKHVTETISKASFTTPDDITEPMSSVSVVKDVRPVSASSDEGKVMHNGDTNAQNGEKSPQPMALFGTLKYMKENESKENEKEMASPESDPVNDIFSNMYNLSDPASTPPNPPDDVAPVENKASRPISDVFSNVYSSPESTMKTTTITTENPPDDVASVENKASRPISDVFSNVYSSPESTMKTTTITTEKCENGNAEVVHIKQVTVTHDKETSSLTTIIETPASLKNGDLCHAAPKTDVAQNGYKDKSPEKGSNESKADDTGSSPLPQVSLQPTTLEIHPAETNTTDNGDDSDDDESAQSTPLTPLRISEVGDTQSPLSPHVDANVIISTSPEPLPPPKVLITPETPEPAEPKIKIELSEGAKEGQEETEEAEDVNGHSAEAEPFVRQTLRAKVKNLLEDFSDSNETIMNRHQLCQNTRQRILSWIEKWLSNEEGSPNHRVVLVTGPSGIGKTCVASEVVKRHGSTVAGSHFFEYNNHNLNHNRLKAVIKAIASNFCDVFPNYVHILPDVDKLHEVVAIGSIPEMFDTLIYSPLNSPELDAEQDTPMLIVLDSIDECDPLDREMLTEVINSMTENCPEWLNILLTSRTDSKLQLGHESIHTLEMKPNSNENMVDIKRFFREPLGRFMDRISLDGGLTQLAKKTEGSFLCAMLIKKKLDALPPERKIALREIVPMFPSALSGICKDLFNNFLESLSAVVHDGNERRAYSSILSNIVVSRGPLPIQFLLDVIDTTSKDPRPILSDIDDVLLYENNCVSFCHQEIVDWLLDDVRSGTCAIDKVQGREQIASLCLRWLDDIINEDQSDINHTPLMEYSLKHTVYHLLDVSKQQENLSRLLCNLKYIQSKLAIPGVTVMHVLDDYHHQHIQTNQSGAVKLITLSEYMKRYPKMLEQMNGYRKFLYEKQYEIQLSPDHVLQVAANYSVIERIQQNARLELENMEWIEDVTAVPETHCMSIKFNGVIKAIDLSPDSKTLAVISKDEEYNVWLHLINSVTGDEKIKPIDIKTLNDRVGLLVKFFPDANNVFVGSLTTMLSTRGKPTPSGFDVNGIDVKDKFSVECADVSVKHFACGLTTFPWGGKSLHLCIFDMRTKKCLKTIEVLRFRYGGSGQFGIKACAVAKDKSFVCACVKQSPKPQLRIIMWNVSKFQIVNSIDVNNEEITKSIFVGDQTVLLGGGIRSSQGSKSSAHSPVVSDYWNYKEVTNKVSVRWDEAETSSLFSSHEDSVSCCRWYNNKDNALIHVWADSKITKPSSDIYRIRGVRDAFEMLSGGNCFIFVSHDEVHIYNTDDLELLTQEQEAESMLSLPELVVHSVSFIPRSDTIIVVSEDRQQDSNKDKTFSVFLCSLLLDEMNLIATPFKTIPRSNLDMIDERGQFKTFFGTGASTAMCFSSADGNYIVFNADDHIKLWERSSDSVSTLPTYQDLKNSYERCDDFTGVKAYASPKDSTLAVIYGQIPSNIFLYDMRHGSQLRVLKQEESNRNAVTDVVFIPSNGILFAYHRTMDNHLVTWNPRTGEQVMTVSTTVSYARASPESDRLAISARSTKRKEGHVILRNSDNKVNRKLVIPDTWLPSNGDSDLEFSGDGTTLVGVCFNSGISRVWSAANGEVLNDLQMSFSCPSDIVGMLTNTHVVFQDDRLIIVDIATGTVSAIYSLDEKMEQKSDSLGMMVSPKGGMVVGKKTSSHLQIFRCHNFSTIKRKTTLQRMISVKK